MFGFFIDSTCKICYNEHIKSHSRCPHPRCNARTGEELWINDETITLPSDIEILIDDAHLMLAEGKYLNMLTTGDMVYAASHSELGDTHHITVRNVISEAQYATRLPYRNNPSGVKV